MSTLGEILDRLHDRAQVYEILAVSGDLPLIAELDQIAHQLDQIAQQEDGDPCDLALHAVQAFTSKADDEAWVKLISRLQNSHSPAGTCLSEMITWSLAR
jgi:hypothetical protein